VEAAKWRALAVESDDDVAGGDGDEADVDVEADEDEADEGALRLGAPLFFVNALFLYAIEQKAHGGATNTAHARAKRVGREAGCLSRKALARTTDLASRSARRRPWS
jgi:hypothetical protein